MRHQSQASCTNRAPREFPHHELQEEALIKVSVMYPNKPDVRFDHEYYRTKHLPLIKSRMGAALKYYTIDKGLADREGRPLSPYVAMCHLLCDSVEEYQSSFGPHAQEIREVVVENSAKVETAALHRIPINRGSSPHKCEEVIP